MTDRILIAPGEPAGIGPDVALTLADANWPVEIVVLTDPALMKERARQLNLQIDFEEIDISSKPVPSVKGQLKIWSSPLVNIPEPGTPDPKNAHALLKALSDAVRFCMNGQAAALVTGPINKATINQSGIGFSGHTEYLQAECGVDQVVMMLATRQLKVALVSTHLPLKNVAEYITKDRLNSVLNILMPALKSDFGLKAPRLAVAGLNPHAGEQGYLGTEEIDTIIPTLDKWRQKGSAIIGPLPADTLYTPDVLKNVDATLAMYHDQGLPVLKYSGFGQAVNITLGLPIIRTSVDHGTAFDLAGTGKANSGSLHQAVEFAIEIASNRQHSIKTQN